MNKITISGFIAVAVLVMVFLIPSISASGTTSYVTRGDMVWSEELIQNGSCWYFPSSGGGILYDRKPISQNNKTYCYLSPEETNKLSALTYTLIYEEPAYANGKYFKDVSYQNNSLKSLFATTKSIDESGSDGPSAMRDFLQLINTTGFNTISTDTIVFQNPELKIAGITRTNENEYTITGTSNYANNTIITIKMDPEFYRDLANASSFTWTTTLSRPSYSTDGSFTGKMLFNMQEESPGWHDVAVYAGSMETTVKIKIDQQEWKPAPTPTEYVKYLSNGDIAPEIVTVIQTQIITVNHDVWHTATPTPAITDAIGNVIEYPYKPGDQLPDVIVMGCVGIIAILVLVRGWKWN